MHDFYYFRSVYYFLLVVLFVSLIIVTFQKRRTKLINRFSLFSILFVCMGVSVISSYMIGYGADDLNLGGDEKSFDLFIATVVLSIINLLIMA